MAAVAEISADANKMDSKPKQESEFSVQKLVDMFTKLNPLAKEFFPATYSPNHHDHLHRHLGYNQFSPTNFLVNTKPTADDNFPNNRRRRNNFNQGRRRLNGKTLKAQREDSIRRTVYVSDIDQHVTEERLAALFSTCGQVIDCRICGDPHSVLRFAFVEFADEHGARAALNLGGTVLGYYPVRVLPSKTAILPVNPTFLPRSDDEREMCTRTVYCTNIDKKVSQAEVKNFFESACGEVLRLRLLGDHVHSTRIAFVEFAMAESAIIALNCSGMPLGTQPIRVSPSKTPVRPRVTRPTSR
ncbi:polyadenylate-binding protein-interacting protein 9-like [Gastrolobium bilobum]|uniref:polyadenylate-binding protein-interacting protein 9-like n=1 Tax=Gastrolobium bilobum TaxID=150636 RepID=UPI002AB0E9FA|nr:polyadenylate-binding protein-interacting protein 9-like [Gastrolobium bilobum]